MVVPRARLLSLAKVQSNIFEQTFNPECKRLGNKVLRQRLRGPALASYYPRKTVSFRDLQDLYRPMGFDAVDPFEEMRQEHVEYTKSRGKGPPKKKAEAEKKGGKRR